MIKNKLLSGLLVILICLVAALPAAAAPGQPNFGPAVYGDGQAWGTKFAHELPTPKGDNWQSFDKLFVITNGSEGQLPVSEAAPGNPDYNGGRWYTHTAVWTPEGMAYHGGDVPVLTSYAELMVHADLGHIEINAGSPPGGPPDFFECPLLPIK